MLRSTLVVGLWTLFSRLLGMFRDVATAAVLGMSAGGIMDSFVVAFRLPDMARKLFGDGSLGVSYIPVFTKTWQKSPENAWSLFSATLSLVFAVLTGLVLVGEVVCWIGITLFLPESRVRFIACLLALLLPYVILISTAAITAATLQSLGRFSIAALIPAILNVSWLLGILLLVPFSSEPETQCYVLTICILFAGIVQFFAGFPILRSYGFRFTLRFRPAGDEIKKVFYGFFPQFFGLMTVQLNLLIASILAWLFSGTSGDMMWWLGGVVSYPIRQGSASAIYYSERLFEFPQGLIGMAVATVIYPLLSRHAANRNYTLLGEDLSIGIRLQFVFSIPAGLGMMLMSERLAHLLFQRGAFTPSDSFRTADMIFWFSSSVWAFCLLPIIIRAFYVVGDMSTPCRVGVAALFFNLVLGFILLWPMQEQGLAVGISLTASFHAILLLWLFTVKHGHVLFKDIGLCIVRSCAASVVMALDVVLVMKALPGTDSLSDVYHIVLGGCSGMFVYFMSLRALGGRELGILIRGKVRKRKRRSSG